MLTSYTPFSILQNAVTPTVWEHSSAGRASALQAGGHRFEPYCSHHDAGVAQLVEQLICNQQVRGSNPFTSSTNSRKRVFFIPYYFFNLNKI